MTQSFTPDGVPGSARNVAVIGGINLDISAGSHRAFVPGDSTPGWITTTAGGVARNIAENLARLGEAAHLIGAVGDDLQGQFLLNHTRSAGVDVSKCRIFPGLASGSYLSLHQQDGALLGAVNDMAVLDLLDAIELARHAGFLATASAWVLDCNLSEAAIGWLMQCAGPAKSALPVFVDGVSGLKCKKILPWLQAVHTLKINRLEAQTLTGLQVSDAGQAQTAAQNLCARGVENAVVSLGSSGVSWHQRSSDASGHVSALAVTPVNSNGAGDAITAGLVHGALAGWQLEQSVRFANACAALTMTSSAANHPDLSVANVSRLMVKT